MLLVVLAFATAVLAMVDLLTAFAGGIAMLGLPVLGAILGWQAGKRSASRGASLAAIAANAVVLIVVVVAIFVYGGS